VLTAGAISIFGGCEKAIVAARGGAWVIVPVSLHLIIPLAVSIVAVIVSMVIRAHDLMVIRAMFVWTFLCADHCRHKPGHGNSCQGKQCRFPKVLAHVAILPL
jgi:hypothetical protein